MKSLAERDRKVIWHPYSQHGLNREILPVVSASGAYIKLADGRDILDGISSWWVNIHGHAHPQIVRAIAEQAAKMEHVIFAGFTHEPAIELAELLTSFAPIQSAGLSRVFYSDNGSTAVEVALKMAYQYHLNQGCETRRRFIALSHSYHGDTLGAMAVGEPSGFHRQFRPLMPEVDFVEAGNLAQLTELLEHSPNSHAAFIFEPLVQGAAGMLMYDPVYLQKAVALCREKNVLTICDEVFTGFYRTGKCFAFQHVDIRPDLLCLSKGITAGFLPLAVTLTTEKVYSAFISKEIRTAFLHGHSYTANPIACAAAVASWHLIQSPETWAQIEMIVARTRKHVERLRHLPGVKETRCLGTIGVVELNGDVDYYSSSTGSFLTRALAQGVLLRPLGNVLYTVPPYCCTEAEIDRLYQVIENLCR
jgi:adenosylmethionine-8-amino-7-oxononanoate aminotransferase